MGQSDIGRYRHGYGARSGATGDCGDKGSRQPQAMPKEEQGHLQHLMRQEKRNQRVDAKLSKEGRVREREFEVDSLNRIVEKSCQALSGILEATLDVDDSIDFDTLKS